MTVRVVTRDEAFELVLLRLDNALEDLLWSQGELNAVVVEAGDVLVNQR